MNAEIISIGDELLIGQVVNTNASYISRELNAAGIHVRRVTTIGDEMDEILSTFERAWREQTVVIVTGGLGPTHDDVSKAAVAQFFGNKLVLNEPTLRAVEARFRAFGYDKVPESSMGQAMVPEGFTALRNERGTAPGLLFQSEGKTFVILPGVPVEMEWLMQNGVLETLRATYRNELEIIRHRTLLTIGVGESSLAERIGDPKAFLAPSQTLAFLPKNGSVRLRITTRGRSPETVRQESDRVEAHLRDRAGRFIYGVEGETLEANILETLREKRKTLAVAESCTGGMIGAQLTSVPGASDVFLGGVISYADDVKMRELGVNASTLERHGAVSEETAREMAEGALTAIGSDYALAVTGVAGPGGGSEEKPVGTTWVALAEKGKPTIAQLFRFANDRAMNRERAANSALDMLRKRLLEE